MQVDSVFLKDVDSIEVLFVILIFKKRSVLVQENFVKAQEIMQVTMKIIEVIQKNQETDKIV